MFPFNQPGEDIQEYYTVLSLAEEGRLEEIEFRFLFYSTEFLEFLVACDSSIAQPGIIAREIMVRWCKLWSESDALLESTPQTNIKNYVFEPYRLAKSAKNIIVSAK